MPEPVEIAFASPSGEEVRLEWSPDAISQLGPEGPRAWRLASDVSWDALEAIRLVSARVEDRGLAIAALRPAGSSGHGEETVAGLLFASGEAEQLGESLLSVERGPGGRVRRIGLELYRAESELPIRVAGDATDWTASEEGGIQVERAPLEIRSQGESGFGVYEVLRRG